jgi:hypothetical protein
VVVRDAKAILFVLLLDQILYFLPLLQTVAVAVATLGLTP